MAVVYGIAKNAPVRCRSTGAFFMASRRGYPFSGRARRLVGSGVVDKTSFSVPAVSVGERKTASGKVVINGMVRGHINGTVRGILRATVDGDVDLNVVSGSAGGEEAEQDEQ